MSQENRAAPREKGLVTPTFSAVKGGVALQVASWKVSRYKVVSQLHCRLSRCSGPLSLEVMDVRAENHGRLRPKVRFPA